MAIPLSLQYVNSLNCIYGEPASGKTTLCLLAAVSNKRKVAFIDTENSFSVERLMQINGKLPEHIFLIKANSFMEQHNAIESLLKLKGKFGLIIIDSFTSHYRKALQEKKDVNPMMSRQMSLLSEIAKDCNIPVLLTSQVYATKGSFEPVGSNMLKNWCSCIIRLEKEPRRKLIMEKHPSEKYSCEFEIINEGISIPSS